MTIRCIIAFTCLTAALSANTLSSTTESVARGVRWLASVQGVDGGWGQDGGGNTDNDVANTAVATLALLRTGDSQYRTQIGRGVNFVLKSVEAAPEKGLAITNRTGTQIQHKLGPFIDTFLAATLLAKSDQSDVRVRQALEKCVRKIEANQQQDGSWNMNGGWAPILSTSFASRSLDEARKNGVRVDPKTMTKVDAYTKQASARPAEAAAGVALYQSAQALEQMSRTEADRSKNRKELVQISGQLSDSNFVNGYGSMGGEEFFSYLNISDSLKRTGGEPWTKWNGDIKTRLIKLQNNDGTWAGHHCITGRVAVTSAAVLTMLAEKN